MKTQILWLFLVIGPCLAYSQTKIEKTFPVAAGQMVDFHFDYPKNIKISTWTGKDIAIQAKVNINNGEMDRAFSLVHTLKDGKISISNKLDMDLIPDSYYIVDKGNKIRFNSKKDMALYLSQHKGSSTTNYQQKDIEISIEVKVPVQVSTTIASVYGLVEVVNFNGPIKVDATYGGIDASLTEKSIGKLELINRYGKIYTNMNFKGMETIDKNFYTSIMARPGTGPEYRFNATYGNIYLRRADD